MDAKSRELKKRYARTPNRIGVFQIRNLASGKVFVSSALDLPGVMKRHLFELRAGGHKNEGLQSDWDRYGEEGFVFEVLDELAPRPEPGYDHRADVSSLEEIWLENLSPYGERGYNEKRKTREQRLRMIAENRRRSAEEKKEDEP